VDVCVAHDKVNTTTVNCDLSMCIVAAYTLLTTIHQWCIQYVEVCDIDIDNPMNGTSRH